MPAGVSPSPLDIHLPSARLPRQKSRVLQTEEQKLGKLGKGLEDSDLARNDLQSQSEVVWMYRKSAMNTVTESYEYTDLSDYHWYSLKSVYS